MHKKEFQISIVMAIYNMEEYLEESIESVLNQTIGLEKIELILVNDGSKDGSRDICKHYQKKYPHNIIFVDKENGGVSSARNAGLEIARGKYINFLDSDDKLQEDACEKVLNYFQDHDVDVIAIPLIYFDARNDEHALHWKFQNSRVVDIDEEPTTIQMHIASSFIITEVAQKFRFQTKLKYAEDAEFLTKCILQKRCYGVVSDTGYMYRYRMSDDSAMQRAEQSQANYFPVLRYFYKGLIDYEKKVMKKDHISKYLENLILYELKWKLRRKEVDESVFEPDGKEEYFKELSEVLNEISDSTIMNLDKFTIIHKMFLYAIKYHKTIDEIEEEYEIVSNERKQYVVWNDLLLGNVTATKIIIELINVKNGRLTLQGKIGYVLRRKDIEIFMKVKDGQEEKIYPVHCLDEWRSDTFALNVDIKKRYYFKTDPISIENVKNISFVLKLKGRETNLLLDVARLSYLNTNFKTDYTIRENYIFTRNKRKLVIRKYSKELQEQLEKRYIKELGKREDLELEDEKLLEIKDLRQRYLEKQDITKRIWIFMDRPNKADDNAEHLFKYSVKQKDGIEKYFVVSKDSVDFERMQQYGNVVDYGSDEHKLLMMQAEAIISSHVNNHTYSPFNETETLYYGGLLKAKRVFLQHGITKDDVSGWLHKLNKNLSVFVTASPYEYESIVHGKYGYNDGEVVLTGFARYDNLEDKAQKYILFMPTWDSTVMKMKNDFPVYNPEFINSELFKEINGFLNDKGLNEFLEKMGYKILFKPHPNMLIQMKDFSIGKNVIVARDELSYQDLFAMGSALITDYSSTFFDFAYLKKPVIYYQARQNHYIDGYFNYETMGMGPVVKTQEELIETLKDYIEKDFHLEEKYLERTKKFFKFLDHDNCKRIYEVMREKFD